MPPFSQALSRRPAAAEGPGDLLHASTTTRVLRLGGVRAGERWIRKEYLGAQAAQRRRNEHETLARLAGIAGVVQLAPATGEGDTLLLRDCGRTSLAHMLRAGAAEPAAAVELAAKLARILDRVHRAGVIHRDINPANIVLSAAGEPVLIDFDHAVTACAAGPRGEDAREGEIVGTFMYLAPEQTGRTGRAVDERADLYALGATLYELATGRPPFDETDALNLMRDHLVSEPVAPSVVDARVPRALSDIVMRLLAKAPEQRYQSAEGLLHDLERLPEALARGGEGTFVPGERDFPARLAPPERIVGREAERKLLQDAFAAAQRGMARAVLVEGPPGVGKSALIHELRPLATAAGGWYVAGKFDQYHRGSAATTAVVQALRSLGRLLLAEPKDLLAAHRERILRALGRSAALVAQLPEFGLLLGELPAAPPADPARAEERMRRAVLDLLAAVTSARPLVVVLDDLQWADTRSLRDFDAVVGEAGLEGVLIVGVYRGAEVDASHALAPMLARWRSRADRPAEIALAELPLAHVAELVGRMLRLDEGRSFELAEAVMTLTRGNPFDTVEMLNALRGDGLLRLGRNGWEWDARAIPHFVGRGNVTDLLAARIARLPGPSRELLEAMSCLGGWAPRALLQAASGVPEDALARHLHAPIADGLLTESEAEQTLHFRHDRVHQAVLAGMDARRRGELHLAMARSLARQSAFRQHTAQLYLGCAHLLADAAERREAALLFHGLAVRLAETATYALAELYLSSACDLLAALDDPADAALFAQVLARRHAALYSLGRLQEADTAYAQFESRVTDPLDLTEPACLQIRSLNMRARSADAVRLGMALLPRLGLVAARQAGDETIAAQLAALAEWVREDKRADLSERAAMADRHALATARLLSRLQRSAFLCDMDAAVWLMHESHRLWSAQGPCAALLLCLCCTSSLMIWARQDWRTGYDAARHVLAVGEARGFEPETSEARTVFASSVCHWFEPLENTVRQALLAREGLQGGDAFYACYTYRASIAALLDCAPTLEVCAAEVDAGLKLAQRAGNDHTRALNQAERRLLDSLRGRAPGLGCLGESPGDERAGFEAMAAYPMAEVTWHLRKCLAVALAGDEDALDFHSAAAMPFLDGIAGFYATSHAYFFRALALAWKLQATPGEDRSQPQAWLAALENCRSWLDARARDEPHNFLHLVRLLDAEAAWARGDSWEAARAFDSAMAEAEDRQRPWHLALATERAARFHLAHGMARSGRLLLARSRDHYHAWGARAKVERMQEEHAWLGLTLQREGAQAGALSATATTTTDVLDLMGVLRASQALSSETSMERLASRVTEVLGALTGATRVRVLSWHDGQWWLAAPEANGASARALSLTEASRAVLLPLSAVHYAERTNEPLLVDDAAADDRFALDPYFIGVPLCSMLLVPIGGPGIARTMLYLENRLGRCAFNAKRLDAVMLIAGQLAVSLTNAQMYETLEQRVRSRTRELEATQAQLVATARRAGMAEIANNVLHNVGNILNSINVSAGVVSNTIRNSRVEGLARAVALINANARDLANFMTEDVRGKALIAYLNDVVSALRAERQEALDDLGRLVRSVEHISYVIATQQSHAGPSSVVEIVQPKEVLEEALRLRADAVAGMGLAVERRYEEVPSMALDRQRLLQILVNLIGNAAQAMEAVPEEARCLTLGVGIVREAGRERLRITVRDVGEGISADNLKRLFAHGFTTRRRGHGFGLHSSALAAMEMGGRLTAHSDGPGRGAIFTVEVPLKHD